MNWILNTAGCAGVRTRDGVGAVDFFLNQKIEMSCFRLMFFLFCKESWQTTTRTRNESVPLSGVEWPAIDLKGQWTHGFVERWTLDLKTQGRNKSNINTTVENIVHPNNPKYGHLVGFFVKLDILCRHECKNEKLYLTTKASGP